MANVDVKAQIDRLNKKSAAASSRPGSFGPAGKLMEPKVRAAAVPHAHGTGAVSVDKDHIWAFFDSSYTSVNLTTARVECNQDRKDVDGYSFRRTDCLQARGRAEEVVVSPSFTTRPHPQDAPEDMGSLGGRSTGL